MRRGHFWIITWEGIEVEKVELFKILDSASSALKMLPNDVSIISVYIDCLSPNDRTYIQISAHDGVPGGNVETDEHSYGGGVVAHSVMLNGIKVLWLVDEAEA